MADKKYTKKQQEMQKSIKEKLTSQRPKKYKEDKHGRHKTKVFDASPTILSKAGMTKSKHYGTPIYSKTYVNGKLTEVGEGVGGTVDTSFKGWKKKERSKGLAGGGSVRLAKKGGGRAYGKNS